MKDLMAKILLGALIVLCLSPFIGCGMGGEESGTTPDESTSGEAPDTTPDTDDAVPVIADPTPADSVGLSYISNGDGSCTLTGAGVCTDTSIIIPEKSEAGELITKIAPDAFVGNSSITAVQIPAGIVEIGARAFTNCPALSYISVDDENTKYTDMGGILYTADGIRLLCLPAGSSYVSLTLNKKIKQIAEGATEGCAALKKIVYEGSREDFKTVNVAGGNSPFAAASMTFMAVSGK